MKPVIYVANVAESDLADPRSNPHVDQVAKLSGELDSGMVVISAQVISSFMFPDILKSINLLAASHPFILRIILTPKGFGSRTEPKSNPINQLTSR
jgi:hypothetical protein